MKLIIDDKIPYIKGVFEPFGEVVYLPGKETTREVVKDADALITRTRTICNEELLQNSSVQYIATATIGFDHIDTAYCSENGIEWSNAPGCNSGSVQQYMASALMVLANRKKFKLSNQTIGIIGVGHVGSKVEKLCKILGMRVLLYDPPRERKEGSEKFSSLQTICEEADLITFHVPLNRDGQDKTFHMADNNFIDQLKHKPILFNTCRGEVFDSESIKMAFTKNKIEGIVLDCWENEPQIDRELLAMAEIGTPHIAGYSKDGKSIGTTMSVQAVSRHFHLGLDNWHAKGVAVPDQTIIDLNGFNEEEQNLLSKAILFTHDVRKDDEQLRRKPDNFEQLRGDYPLRREFPVFTIKGDKLPDQLKHKLKQLGFQLG